MSEVSKSVCSNSAASFLCTVRRRRAMVAALAGLSLLASPIHGAFAASLVAEVRNMPLLKNEWVEMGDPAPPHRRTHGGTGAGALALVKPLPPKAVAGRPGFTRVKRPRLRSPPAERWAAGQTMRSRQASCRAPHHPFEIQKSQKYRRPRTHPFRIFAVY